MPKTQVRDDRLIKEVIRECIDPIMLLEHYNIDIPQRNIKYDKVRCACPIHDGDNPSGFFFDLNSKQFTCYTGHCGEDLADWFFVPKGSRHSVPRDLFMFIKLMEEKQDYEKGLGKTKASWGRVLRVASEIAGIDLDSGKGYDKEMSDKLDNQKWMREMAKVTQDIELDTFDDDAIDIFRAQLPLAEEYLATRNFDLETLDFFEIGFSPEGVDEAYNARQKDFAGRIVFPVRNEQGELVGWSGRLATDDKVLIKKMHKWHHKLDFEKSFVLYNFNNAKDYIKDSKELVLVEGPFDVIRLWTYGIYNVVAVMGSALTPEQLTLAVSSALRVNVFLDSDGAGKVGAKRICEQLKPYVDVYTIEVEGGKDPDNLTVDEAWIAISNPKKYIG